jgi:hypothetical protein
LLSNVLILAQVLESAGHLAAAADIPPQVLLNSVPVLGSTVMPLGHASHILGLCSPPPLDQPSPEGLEGFDGLYSLSSKPCPPPPLDEPSPEEGLASVVAAEVVIGASVVAAAVVIGASVVAAAVVSSPPLGQHLLSNVLILAQVLESAGHLAAAADIPPQVLPNSVSVLGSTVMPLGHASHILGFEWGEFVGL